MGCCGGIVFGWVILSRLLWVVFLWVGVLCSGRMFKIVLCGRTQPSAFKLAGKSTSSRGHPQACVDIPHARGELTQAPVYIHKNI